MSENTAYFCDGDTLVGLDGEPSVVVEYANPVRAAMPANALNALHRSRDGDWLSVTVKGGVRRYNRGDAEWYVYTKLRQLGVGGVGELYVNGLVWIGAVFVRGWAKIEAPSPVGCWVEYSYEFEVSSPESISNYTPSFSSPEPPTEYPDRNDAGEFYYKGVAIGEKGGWLMPRVRRRYVAVAVPRCRGLRLKDIKYGRVMLLELDAFVRKENRTELEEALRDMSVGFGNMAGVLSGNGNVFEDCYLTGWRAWGLDGRFERLSLRFVQEITQV